MVHFKLLCVYIRIFSHINLVFIITNREHIQELTV